MATSMGSEQWPGMFIPKSGISLFFSEVASSKDSLTSSFM